MSRAPVIYQEARLSLAPASPSQVLYINTGGLKQSTIFGAGRKRNFDEISGLDEEAYTRKCLATEGSVFFRRSDRSPRSFLWRVLEDRKVLEIQCVDLLHDLKGAGKDESRLTFRIGFKDAIISNGVAFADPEEVDSLECYVLTSGKELFTITLKRDLLTRDVAPLDFDAGTCFRKYAPSAFSYRHPYRFVAISNLELLVSLHDGGFMRLERKQNETGSQWRELLFSEQSWGNTLRGMITLKRNQSVRYGDFDLAPGAVAALAKSPDGKHFWTVSVDHELRIWDTRTGKAVGALDLLDEKIDEETKKQQRYLMGAEQGTLIHILRQPPASKGGKSSARMDVDEAFSYYIVVHSPKEHEFKFYGVSLYTSPEGEIPHLEDLQPSTKLIPPIDELLSSNIWHLEEFYVTPGPGWQDNHIWIRARSGPVCRIFTLNFDLLNSKGRPASIVKKWKHGWTVVDPGFSTRLYQCVDFPGQLEKVANAIPTVSEKWIDFLFRPGRFDTACLESAEHIYRKGRGLPPSSGKGLKAVELPLKQRLTHAVESKVILVRRSNEQPDYDKYASDVQAQWKVFYSLLAHLHSKRHESIGLAFDSHSSLAWDVCADSVGPVLGSSPFDRVCLNEDFVVEDRLGQIDGALASHIFQDEDDVTVVSIMAAARTFRASLSPEFREKFARDVTSDALAFEQGDNDANAQHVNAMYEDHNFSGEVTDDDFQSLTDTAESFGGLGSLDLSSFLAILEKMDEDDEDRPSKAADKGLCRYGDRLAVEIVQRAAERHRAVLLDVLNLVVFMLGDLDPVDLHSDFISGAGELLEAIFTRIKHNALVTWLASTVVPESQDAEKKEQRQQEDVEGLSAAKGSNSVNIPLLLRLFVAGWKATSSSGDEASLPFLLTTWSKAWISELDLFKQWDDLTAFVFSYLVKNDFQSLATDFTKFLPRGESATAWRCYLEGRHSLAIGDLVQSSLKFRAAADEMAGIRTIASLDRAHLLSPEQQTYFGSGPSRYFQHIIALYESQRLFSYVADFASLALERCDEDTDLASSLATIDKRKAAKDSPVANRIEDTMEEIRILKLRERMEELRNRLFNALVQTGRFQEAWECLVHLGDTRKSNLVTWIKRIVENDAVEELLEVSSQDVGDAMLQEIDTALISLAKKSLASRTSTPYHQILYAFRTQRSDFRGAAEILHDHLERVRVQSSHTQDPEDETLVQAYVLLINTLACCGEEEAWFLAEPSDEKVGKRKLVTLADIRRDYTAELDRRSDVLMGRFPLVGGGDEMDVL